MSLPNAGDRFGRYQIVRRIGRGGMGVVFLATQEGLDRQVALKLLSPEFVDVDDYQARFRREAAALGRQESPHIVAAYDAGEHDGWLYLATQYIAGEDLQQHLERHGRMAVDDALDVVQQVLAGLAVAHQNGLIHRDIKPSNVLLRTAATPARVFLCDLGISHMLGSEHTKTAGVVGTLGYMAPERHRGEEATFASDIYAVGCLLYALLTGHAPYRGTDYRVADDHVHAPIPTLDLSDEVNRQVQPILIHAMAKNPEHRYRSADEMAADLGRAAAVLARGAATEDLTLRRPYATADVTELRPHPAALSDSVPPGRVRRRGFGPAIVVAAVMTVLLLAIAAWAVTRQALDDTSTKTVGGTISSPAQSPGVVTSDLTASSSPSTPDLAAAPSTGEKTAPPAVQGVAAPYIQQPCDGRYVVMLATSGVATETVSKLNEAIDAVPRGGGLHPAYLAGAGSCRAFEKTDPITGDPIYNAYLGPYPTLDVACQALASIPSEKAWVRRLADPSKVREQCMCARADSSLPVLDGSIPSDRSLVVRRAVATVQWAFYQLRLNTKDAIYGNYTPDFVRQVTAYQASVGLDPTGVVDVDTWHSIKAEYCPTDKFLGSS